MESADRRIVDSWTPVLQALSIFLGDQTRSIKGRMPGSLNLSNDSFSREAALQRIQRLLELPRQTFTGGNLSRVSYRPLPRFLYPAGKLDTNYSQVPLRRAFRQCGTRGAETSLRRFYPGTTSSLHLLAEVQ